MAKHSGRNVGKVTARFVKNNKTKAQKLKYGKTILNLYEKMGLKSLYSELF